ncbi:unnamed protein product [Rhodiola kirilowii]
MTRRSQCSGRLPELWQSDWTEQTVRARSQRQGWRNDNNAPREPVQQTAPQQAQQSSYYRPSSQSISKSLEDVVKELQLATLQLAATVQQNQAKTDGAISELSKQMSQLATTVSELKNEPGRLPSQTIT